MATEPSVEHVSTRHIGLLNVSWSYFRAAEHLICEMRTGELKISHAMPIWFLPGHATELVLKAYLFLCRVSQPDLQKPRLRRIEDDTRRDRWLEAQGFKIIRVPSGLASEDPEDACALIAARLGYETVAGVQTDHPRTFSRKGTRMPSIPVLKSTQTESKE